MFKIITFYGGLCVLVGLAVLGAAQSNTVPDIASLEELTEPAK